MKEESEASRTRIGQIDGHTVEYIQGTDGTAGYARMGGFKCYSWSNAPTFGVDVNIADLTNPRVWALEPNRRYYKYLCNTYRDHLEELGFISIGENGEVLIENKFDYKGTTSVAGATSVGLILRKDADLYDKKKADYAPNSNPWENFDFASKFTAAVCKGLPEDDRRRATAHHVGTKVSRLMTLGLSKSAKNESILDTLADLRVYAAILEAQQVEASK